MRGLAQALLCVYTCVFVWWTSRLLTAKGRINVPPVGLFVCLNDSQLISKIDCGWEMRVIAQARPLLISVEFRWDLAAE